ncbi:hypothetical protein GCM10023215_54830 [Pseudonocardia yuanmonensis]|uniref:Uncharacterized protein n=1 Tax=Pseudonocardia yuanmonensis TaxID=1095914 RepID=A0ABP8XJ06_9PSEU
MTPIRGTTRAQAVEELLRELSNLLVTCYSVPETEREVSWAADADRITGHIALTLATARARLGPDARAVTAPTLHVR